MIAANIATMLLAFLCGVLYSHTVIGYIANETLIQHLFERNQCSVSKIVDIVKVPLFVVPLRTVNNTDSSTGTTRRRLLGTNYNSSYYFNLNGR